MASAGSYATLHLAPDRQPRQHPTTQFFTGRMPFLPPNQQRQSTEGNSLRKIKRERSRVRRFIADSQRPDTRGSSSIRVCDRRLLCSDATRRDRTRRDATRDTACSKRCATDDGILLGDQLPRPAVRPVSDSDSDPLLDLGTRIRTRPTPIRTQIRTRIRARIAGTRTSIGTRNRFRLRCEFGRDTTPDPGRYSDSDTGLDSDPDPTPIVTTASSSETNLPGADQLAHESARRNTHTQRHREISVALIGRTTGAISAASSNNRRAIGSESSRIAFVAAGSTTPVRDVAVDSCATTFDADSRPMRVLSDGKLTHVRHRDRR